MIIETVISRPAAGGEFIADHDGRIVFVTGGIVGEKVRVEIANPDAKLWRGHVVDVIEPSPYRVEHMCAAAAAGAGCCDWDYIDPVQSAEYKRQIVQDCLRRLGHFNLDDLPEMDVVQLEPLRHWRSRARLGIDASGRAGLHKARSNELVVDQLCSQNIQGLTEGLDTPEIVGRIRSHGLTNTGGRRRRQQRGGLGELHVAIDSTGNRHVVQVRGRGKNRREDLIEGRRTTTEVIRGVVFDIPVTGFWQAHRAAADFYASRVAQWLPTSPGATAWDLYGGVGVFSVPLAELVAASADNGRRGRVISVEEFPAAAKAGRKAFASFDGGVDVEFLTSDVTEAVHRLTSSGKTAMPHLVVCDPPRSGAGAQAVSAVAHAAPKHVLHFGCDPATFARDARSWVDNGYEIERLEVVDAFPGTHHVEVLCLLSRK